MLYLMNEMAVLLLASFALGVLVAWLIWRRSNKSGAATSKTVGSDLNTAKASSDLKAERNRAAALQNRCDEKDREILQLKSQLEASRSAETGLGVTRGRLGQEAQEALAQGDMSAALEAENARLRGRISELNETLRSHTNEQERLQALEAAQIEAEQEIEGLQQALSQARAEQAAHGNEAAEDQRVALEAEVNRLRAELAGLTAEYEGEDGQRALESRLTALKQERDQARSELGGLRETIADLEGRRTRRRALEADKDAEIIRLRARLVPNPPSNDQNERAAAAGGGGQSETSPAAPATSRKDSSPQSGEAAPAAQATGAADIAVQERPAMLRPGQPFGEPDDLQIVSGIGPKLSKALNEQGIYHFWQLAALTDEQLAWLDENMLSFKGRIKREGWVEQAKVKHAELHGEDYQQAVVRHLG